MGTILDSDLNPRLMNLFKRIQVKQKVTGKKLRQKVTAIKEIGQSLHTAEKNPSFMNDLKIQGKFNSNFNVKLKLSSHEVGSYEILGLPKYKIYRICDRRIVRKRF